ncbi:hypothetical protein ACQY0O_006038 [Thecaphora frezii]
MRPADSAFYFAADEPHRLARRRGNEALRVNPPNADLSLTRWGSSWLWAVFSVMAVTTLAVLAWSMIQARGRRAFHYLFAAVLATASLSYFSMASDLGAVPITVEFRRNSPLGAGIGGLPTRQVWYARYIDWTITTPLLLLSLLLMTPMPLSTIFITLFFDIFMIICGLIGALVRTSYKWGYFTMGCAALGYVLYSLFVPGLRSSGRFGAGYRTAYLGGVSYLGLLWLLYPVCWGLSEGGNVIRPSSEMLFYGILDLLTKPVFCLYHLFMLRNCEYDAMDLRSGKASEGYGDGALGPAAATGMAGHAPAMGAAGPGVAAAPGAGGGGTTDGPHGDLPRMGEREKGGEAMAAAPPPPAPDMSRPTQ